MTTMSNLTRTLRLQAGALLAVGLALPPTAQAAPSGLSVATVGAARLAHYRYHVGFYSHRYYRPYGYYYGGYGYWPYAGGGYRSPAYWTPDMGAIDLGVKPKKAQVYVDGEYVGTVDNFDGFPTYLWLVKGSYQLIFYRDGYETYVQTVTVPPGSVIDLKYRMREGQATPPDQYVKVKARDEEPPRRERPAHDQPARSREVWREQRVERDLRSAPAQLRLKVSPGDAAVYLDGRFLGSGEELARLHSPLIVDPGAHRLEVTRPGYDDEVIELETEGDEEIRVEVELEPSTDGSP